MENKLRAVGTNHLGCKYARFVLDKDSVNEMFVLLANRRDIKRSQVMKLRRVLEAGDNFDTPLVCNVQGKKYRLIDGNHRREAMVQFFEKYPDRRVEVGIFTYDNLSDEEEREKFTKWNAGMKQSVNDFIKQYWDEMPMTRWIERDFPWKISHAWTSSAMEFKMLLCPYLASKSVDPVFRGGAMELIEAVQNLTKEDYLIIKQFMVEYISVFGNPDRNNSHYKQTPFYVTARIWFLNRGRFAPEKMRKRLQRLLGSAAVVSWSKSGASTQNVTIALREFLMTMNANITRETELLQDVAPLPAIQV